MALESKCTIASQKGSYINAQEQIKTLYFNKYVNIYFYKNNMCVYKLASNIYISISVMCILLVKYLFSLESQCLIHLGEPYSYSFL